MYCEKCGTEMKDGTNFCPNCGTNTTENTATPEKEAIILECKGSLQGGGWGKIILTNKRITWTKSKGANFLMVGVLSFLTKGDTTVNLEQITGVNTYTFLGGGGLQVHTIGKAYKFGFNSVKDRDKAMTYINSQMIR